MENLQQDYESKFKSEESDDSSGHFSTNEIDEGIDNFKSIKIEEVSSNPSVRGTIILKKWPSNMR